MTSLSELLRDAGIASQISIPTSSMGMASAAERVLIETAIEAVMNIIKHAPKSKSASISVHSEPDRIELVVTNTGPLSPVRSAASPGGRGLRRARQRLEQIGGQLESVPTEQGWELRASVPAARS